MQNSKTVSTTLATHLRLLATLSSHNKEEQQLMSCLPYSSAVGSIMYAIVCTHLDISQAVRVVSCYMANPDKFHWHIVKWILCYLRGIIDVGLVYYRGSVLVLVSLGMSIWIREDI